MFSAHTLDRGGNCRLQDDHGKPASCDIRVAASSGGVRAALIALKADGRATGALVSSASPHDGIIYKRQSDEVVDLILNYTTLDGEIQSWLLVLAPTAGGVFPDEQTVTAVISANNLPLAEFTVDAALLPESQCLQLLEIYRHPAQGVKCRAHGAGYPVDVTNYVAALGLPAETILQKWLVLTPTRRTHDVEALRDLQQSVAAPLPVSPAPVQPAPTTKTVAADIKMLPAQDMAFSAAELLPVPETAVSPSPRVTMPLPRAAAPTGKATLLDEKAVVQGAITACCLAMVADGKVEMAERRQTMDAIMQIPAARYFPEYDVKCVMDEQLSILRRNPQGGELAALNFLHRFAGRREGAQIVDALKFFAGVEASETNQKIVARLIALLQKRQAAA